MKLSDVLWNAANIYLWSGDTPNHGDGNAWSCGAAETAEIQADLEEASLCWVVDFLETLGVDSCSSEQFEEFERGPERQGARYLWLDFARLVAEDEGL
jgi:hypothetical protein